MSLESYRNEALGFEETPQTHREVMLPKVDQEKELDKVRRILTCIEFELLEEMPNWSAIRKGSLQIQDIMKGYESDYSYRARK